MAPNPVVSWVMETLTTGAERFGGSGNKGSSVSRVTAPGRESLGFTVTVVCDFTHARI